MTLPFKFQSKTLIEEGKTTQAAINEIKNWLKTTSLPQLQEEFIGLFLLSCLNDVSCTKQTIEAYVRTKNAYPEIFNDCHLDHEDTKHQATEVICSCVVPVRMNNSVIIFVKLEDTNYRNFDITCFLKICVLLTSVCQIYNPPNELIVIVDPKGFSLMHLTRLRIGVLKAYIEYLQDAMPLKIKNIHILNANYVIEKLYALLKIFMKSELIEAIKLHSPGMRIQEFHKEWIPTMYLPKEYGGDLPSIEKLKEKTMKQIKQQTQFFQAEERLRTFPR